MGIRVVGNGKDPLTRPALEYLEALGVPARHIRRIRLDSPVGDYQTITVTLFVLDEPCSGPAPGEPTDGGCE
jgi:hypothetical protein